MKKVKKNTAIKPRYIKDEKGKTQEVYLDIDDYNAILKRVAQYEKIKKEKKIAWISLKQ